MTKQQRESFEKWWSNYGLDFDLSRNLRPWQIGRVKNVALRAFKRGLALNKYVLK